MTESLITISIVGLIAGFLFSMPIAGPISVLITSNALKGRVKFCKHATNGASLADFIYVFIAVFGLTNLYSWYKPVIPYVLIIGALFLIYLGIKIFNTNLDLEHIGEGEIPETKLKKKDKNGFWTGFLLNFLNPTLFLGWLTSSFFVISFVASMGLNTGGLNNMIDQNVKNMNSITGNQIDTTRFEIPSYLKIDSVNQQTIENQRKDAEGYPSYFPLCVSILYALFLSLGSIIWFYYLTWILAKHRHKIKVIVVKRIIQGLGLILCGFGLFLGYKAIIFFLA